MHIDRMRANQFLAYASFTLCFLFLLALVAFAFF
jgi:hypothetical protein